MLLATMLLAPALLAPPPRRRGRARLPTFVPTTRDGRGWSAKMTWRVSAAWRRRTRRASRTAACCTAPLSSLRASWPPATTSSGTSLTPTRRRTRITTGTRSWRRSPGCAGGRRRSCGTGTSWRATCGCGSCRSGAGKRATRCRSINTWARTSSTWPTTRTASTGSKPASSRGSSATSTPCSTAANTGRTWSSSPRGSASTSTTPSSNT
mmetsp:Transcript_21938/g.70625  ORF Transcript_21938/g.70625 Transcript_21938/m.70625 type:complete len:209 (+) Transcript_21938:122-748(+)